MTRRTLALAGLLIAAGWPAAAQSADSVNRAQTQVIDRAIQNQIRSGLHPAGRPGAVAGPYSGAAPYPAPGDLNSGPYAPPAAGRSGLAAGPRTVMNAAGATMYAGPAPGTPILGHLDPGATVIVTRPADAGGWAEVVAGGNHGYVWSPQLTPQGFPPPPWDAGRR